MIEIGKWNKLLMIKKLDFGIYLDGEELGEILLPKENLVKNFQIDELLNVFIYYDSEDRIIATRKKPYAEVGEFAYLKVKEVTSIGAFLDWGLQKDLFVPFIEQNIAMEDSHSYLVYVYFDQYSRRIVASARISKFISRDEAEYNEGDKVRFIVFKETDIGYKILVDNKYLGMIFKNEIFEPITLGQKMIGFVKKIREDNKIDISLKNIGIAKIDDTSKEIIDLLEKNNGVLPVSDKSSPELISKYFKMSKKTFKKSIGFLYKNHLIALEPHQIKLIK